MKFLYLDYNATSPMIPSVAEAMAEVFRSPCGLNASSVHAPGRQARAYVEDARYATLRALGASEAYALTLTGSGTEANNMLALGHTADHWVLSAVEHSSLFKLIPHAQVPVHIVPVGSDGLMDLGYMTRLLEELQPAKVMCSVMLANNETGAIQPVGEIARLVHHHGGYLHTDASQAVGKIPVNMTELEVDALTISAHKFGGPQGVGGLVRRKTMPLKPRIMGGGQEKFLRAGTENIAGIVGLHEAIQCLPSTLSAMQKLQPLRDHMEGCIRAISPNSAVVSKAVKRLPNTSCITMPNVGYETQLMHFDLENIAVSAGSACSSGKVDSSHVLKAMGLPEGEAKAAIRVSLPLDTTSEAIDRFVAAWMVLYQRCCVAS